MTEWFMCLFSRTLPWSSVLRVWDMFFCEGVKVLFRVGLVILKYGLRPQVLKRCPGMYETLQALRNIDHGVMAEGFLLFQVSDKFFMGSRYLLYIITFIIIINIVIIIINIIIIIIHVYI
ncbi:TBC1 domain family member 10A-like, partial [Homarus americanus]